jgi:DNA-binding Lrp family transcriptional regulator
MAERTSLDPTDAHILLRLAHDARTPVVALSDDLGLARNTVHSRLLKMERGALHSYERRVDLVALGYPIRAFVSVRVRQDRLDAVGESLSRIPEVLEVVGVTGDRDLHVDVVARDADDLYRVAGAILAVPGVRRTSTAFAMRTLVSYRVAPLLRRLAKRD